MKLVWNLKLVCASTCWTQTGRCPVSSCGSRPAAAKKRLRSKMQTVTHDLSSKRPLLPLLWAARGWIIRCDWLSTPGHQTLPWSTERHCGEPPSFTERNIFKRNGVKLNSWNTVCQWEAVFRLCERRPLTSDPMFLFSPRFLHVHWDVEAEAGGR